MLSYIDNFLNRITMYRLVLYYLLVLLAAALAFGFTGTISAKPLNLTFSVIVILVVCLLTNAFFAKMYGAIANAESFLITAFILALIVSPVAPTDYRGIGFLVFVSAWAMAAKYIFAMGKKHIFNPAAFGVALGALVLGHSATWWVGGNLPLAPFVVLGGLLVVRKIRRFDLFISFSIVTLLTVVLTASGSGPVTAMSQTLIHSSFFFLGLVMLTEPLTMPPSRSMRIVYGAIVGFLFAPNIHLGSYYFTPEIALLIGNVFVYFVSPKGRFMLTLREKVKIADGTYEFVFAPDRLPDFLPGQYLEWTVGHSGVDTRGNRRFFTIASSPTEKVVRLGVKFYAPESSFKRALLSMETGDAVSASHISGDFVMPSDRKEKLVFLAGGIGITPFRSMVRYLLDSKEVRDIVLLYSNKTASEIAYKELFDSAQRSIGLKTVYALTKEPSALPGMHAGMIDGALIREAVPDYKDRTFYISGPHSMVEAFKKTLRELGVSRFRIKTDYFPGFA